MTEEKKESIWEKRIRVVLYENSIRKLVSELTRDRESLRQAVEDYNKEMMHLLSQKLKNLGREHTLHFEPSSALIKKLAAELNFPFDLPVEIELDDEGNITTLHKETQIGFNELKKRIEEEIGN